MLTGQVAHLNGEVFQVPPQRCLSADDLSVHIVFPLVFGAHPNAETAARQLAERSIPSSATTAIVAISRPSSTVV
jgi:hypothetical protein